jgi:beta-xylosidase
MKDGDVAGLGALQKNFGYIAVKKTGEQKTLVNVNAADGNAREFGSIALSESKLKKDIVYFRIEMDFRELKDTAWFAYSLDGVSWEALGAPLKMTYTLPHFIGYRFALFNYATKMPGGYVDFDFFKVSDEITIN